MSRFCQPLCGSDDDTAELLRELQKIKNERAEEEARKVRRRDRFGIEFVIIIRYTIIGKREERRRRTDTNRKHHER